VTARAAGPLLVVVLTSLAACAETTIEPSATTGVTTTIALTLDGTREDLLAQLDEELSALSERIVDDDGPANALVRIEALWEILRPDLESDRASLVPQFEGVITLARSAVTRRRPADADKASLNLQALLTAAS
jgi:hypothetical protein